MKALLLSLLLLSACDAGTFAFAAADQAEANPCERRASSATGVAAPLPTLRGRVTDEANLFSEPVEERLTAQLAELERRTTDQLVVVTTPDLRGESIDSFGLRLGNGWGIGRKDVDNGVLLIVAPNERQVRIEVGCGLEGLLTDERAQSIIAETLLPRLSQGAYEGAAETGVAEIAALLASEPKRPRRRAD